MIFLLSFFSINVENSKDGESRFGEVYIRHATKSSSHSLLATFQCWKSEASGIGHEWITSIMAK